jgi:hypothetical protein
MFRILQGRLVSTIWTWYVFKMPGQGGYGGRDRV